MDIHDRRYVEAGRSIMRGTGSAEWNRFLSRFTGSERKALVKRVRTVDVFNSHAVNWPKEKDFPRYKHA